MENKLYTTKEGYNLAAPYYDEWKWQQFWHLNEYPYVQEWCRELHPGRGLDLGTGSGNSIDCFLGGGHRITAVDISSEMLRICKQKYKPYIENGHLDCWEADIQELGLDAKAYDWVLSNRVLSHIDNLESVFEKIAGLIKIGGTCFISDVHPQHCYKATNLSVENEQVFIETYKHAVCDLKSVLVKSGFRIIRFEEIHADELINQEVLQNFHNLPGQQTPIFYYLIARYEGKK